MAEILNKLLSQPSLNKLADPSLSLMGSVFNKQAAKQFSEAYPFLAPLIENPSFLMQFIDRMATSESGRSIGEARRWNVQKANEALSAIYGINDYTPQGHFKYTKEPGMKAIGSTIPSYTEVEGWTNPRPFMGGQR